MFRVEFGSTFSHCDWGFDLLKSHRYQPSTSIDDQVFPRTSNRSPTAHGHNQDSGARGGAPKAAQRDHLRVDGMEGGKC